MRTRHTTRMLAAALCVGLLAICTTSVHGQTLAQSTNGRPLPSPRALDLRTSDLPTGTGQTLGEVMPDAAAALQESTPLAVLRAQGRTTSYLAAFEYGTAHGLVDVYATVSLYRTARGAHMAYVARSTKLAEMGGLSLGRLGSEGVAYVLGDGMPEYAYLRRGRAVLDLAISGPSGSVTGHDLYRDASIVDARLWRAGV